MSWPLSFGFAFVCAWAAVNAILLLRARRAIREQRAWIAMCEAALMDCPEFRRMADVLAARDTEIVLLRSNVETWRKRADLALKYSTIDTHDREPIAVVDLTPPPKGPPS